MSKLCRGETSIPAPGIAPPSFSFQIRVYYEDTDAAGMVYYANYLRFCERARSEWLRVLGFEQQRLAQEYGVAFAARSVAVEYLKPARLDDVLNIVSEIESVARAQIVFVQRVERQGESGPDILVTATTRIACVAAARAKAMAMPKIIYEKFNALGRRA